MKTYYDILAAYPNQQALVRHLEARIAWMADQQNEDKWFAMEETYETIDPTESQANIINNDCDERYTSVDEFFADMRTLDASTLSARRA